MSKARYYKELGLAEHAPIQDIRKQYRKLVMHYHPDKNQNPGAEAKFIAITEAYEILIGKKAVPAVIPQTSRRRNTANTGESAEEIAKKRAAEGKARYREQQIREHLDNERYFNALTQGRRWKMMRISAQIAAVLTLFLIADLYLPHHYEETHVTGYNMNSAYGFGGAQISLVETTGNEIFWVEQMSYPLFQGDHPVYIESSWFFHNPIAIVKQDKVEMLRFPLNFNFYSLRFLLIAIFLTPLFTIWYKRRKISFTVLYHFCYYGVNGLIFYFLLTGTRWAHLISLGFL